jgi:kynurenine formamidase
MSKILIEGDRVIDLSQTIAADIPVPVGFPAPKFEMFMAQEEGDLANVEIITMGAHAGTHFDAPYHFFSELRRADELPPDCLMGQAVVVDMTSKKGSMPIEEQDLRDWESASGEEIQPGDIVLVRTDHSHNWHPGEDTSAYWKDGWPYLARSAVDYLAGKPIKAVGVESFDPDWVDLNDLASAEFATHRTFLPLGILVLENLTNLDKIPSTRCYVLALPLKLKGCSGSPVRVVAVV